MNDGNGQFSGRPPGGRGHYALLIVAVFGLIYGGSLTFAYVEGDDATNIAFHALGRQAAVQPPYSPYNGMMDVLLGVLPAREPGLRFAALTLTALAGVVFTLLAAKLAFDWLGEPSPRQKMLAALVTLAAIPEIFFLALVYTPNLIALCFILAAHLVVRRVFAHGGPPGLASAKALVGIALSLALYGFGVACRWETAAYGLVIVADVWLGTSARQWTRPTRGQLVFGFAWGTLALASALGFIAASGYGLDGLLRFYTIARDSAGGQYDAGVGAFAFVGRYQSFFTPALALLGLAGLASFLRHQRVLAIKALIGFLPVLPMLYRGAPKLILPALPGMALCVAQGLKVLWSATAPGNRRLGLRIAVVLLAAGPWLVGLRVYSGGTQWGPGFEIRAPELETAAGGAGKSGKISIGRVAPVFGAGFAAATPEGPRSLGGYGAVFLGGWRTFVARQDAECRAVVEQALAAQRPILQDDGNAMIVVKLLEAGFATWNPRDEFRPDGFNARNFLSGDGRRVTLLQLKKRNSLFDAGQLDALISQAGAGKVILYSGYSSTLSRLLRLAPDAAQPLGPFSAVLDLEQWRQALVRRAAKPPENHANHR